MQNLAEDLARSVNLVSFKWFCHMVVTSILNVSMEWTISFNESQKCIHFTNELLALCRPTHLQHRPLVTPYNTILHV